MNGLPALLPPVESERADSQRRVDEDRPALHPGPASPSSSDARPTSHLLGTCSIAFDYGACEDEAIAALLHDAIEDGKPTDPARRTVWSFGDEVGRIVEGCTDSDAHPKPPWRSP